MDDLKDTRQAEQRRKLFLGGLGVNTATEDIAAKFAKYGQIVDCIVMRYPDSQRSKGFGFITFSKYEETEACLGAGPHIIDDKTIDMKRATPREYMVDTKQEEVAQQRRKIFVGRLNYDTTDEGLKEYFSKFGTLEECILMKKTGTDISRGFGFVTYSTIAEVNICQKNRPHELDGKELQTKRATARGDHSVNDHQGTRIFVGGLSNDKITDDVLEEYFSRFGDILSVEFEKYKQSAEKNGRKRNFAFVEFEDYDAVDQALQEKDHKIVGWKIVVSKALSRENAQIVNDMSKANRLRMGFDSYQCNPSGPGGINSGFGGATRGNGFLDARYEMMNMNGVGDYRGSGFGIGGSGFGTGSLGIGSGMDRSSWMAIASRGGMLGEMFQGGMSGPLRNQMRGSFRRAPY